MIDAFTFLFQLANSIMLLGLSILALSDHELLSPVGKEKLEKIKKDIVNK